MLVRPVIVPCNAVAPLSFRPKVLQLDRSMTYEAPEATVKLCGVGQIRLGPAASAGVTPNASITKHSAANHCPRRQANDVTLAPRSDIRL
ncbi:hypothetical protein D3C85_676460 [compost metagenome]